MASAHHKATSERRVRGARHGDFCTTLTSPLSQMGAVMAAPARACKDRRIFRDPTASQVPPWPRRQQRHPNRRRRFPQWSGATVRPKPARCRRRDEFTAKAARSRHGAEAAGPRAVYVRGRAHLHSGADRALPRSEHGTDRRSCAMLVRAQLQGPGRGARATDRGFTGSILRRPRRLKWQAIPPPLAVQWLLASGHFPAVPVARPGG